MKVHVVYSPEARPSVERVEITAEDAGFAITALEYAGSAYRRTAARGETLAVLTAETSEQSAETINTQLNATDCDMAVEALRLNSRTGNTTEFGPDEYAHIMFGLGRRAARESFGIRRLRSRFLDEYLGRITYERNYPSGPHAQ